MSTKKAWILYSVIRLTLFAVAFAVVWLLGGRWWLAAVIAALVSMAISVLTLDKLRQQASEGLHEWRNQERTEDSIVEDDLIDDNPDLLKGKADPEGDTVG